MNSSGVNTVKGSSDTADLAHCESAAKSAVIANIAIDSPWIPPYALYLKVPSMPSKGKNLLIVHGVIRGGNSV